MRHLLIATAALGALCTALVLGSAGCDPDGARALREHPAVCDLDYQRCVARVSRGCDFLDLDCIETETLVCHTAWLICVRYHDGTPPPTASDAGRADLGLEGVQ